MCEYHFSFERWREHRNPDKITRVEKSNFLHSSFATEWDCPHNSYDESDYCIFHMGYEERRSRNISPKRVQRELINTIKSESSENEFIGANFGRIQFEHRKLIPKNDGKINFNFAEFGGTVRITNCEISKISFSWATFREYTTFHLSEFVDDAIFMGCEFFDTLSISDVQGYLNMDGSIFHGDSRILPDTYPHLSIRNVEFSSDLKCSYSDFERIYLVDSVIGGTVDMAGSNIEDLQVQDIELDGNHIFNLSQSTIDSGYITLKDNLSIIYNLTRATIGDVDLTPSDIDSPFRSLIINNTDFNGFDFSAYRDTLEKSSFTIHNTLAVDTSIEPPSVSEIETTYLKARQGAEHCGDNKAASEFFIKEMNFRRKSTGKRLADSDGLKEKAGLTKSLIGNIVMGVSSRYGESPSRVVLVSLLTVFLYSLLYPLTSGIKHPSSGFITYFSNQPLGSTILNSVYFSLTSFTTVGYGDFQPQSSISKLLAASESLLGVLLLALLIFVLGRSVKW